MARTKKQTIDAASARKRQIQEEILNESLAVGGKRENIKSSSTNQKSGSANGKCGKDDRSKESNQTQPSTDSSGACKSETNGDFPKAVIRITDIYKTSPELLDSVSVKISKHSNSPKSNTVSPHKPEYEDNLDHNKIDVSMDMSLVKGSLGLEAKSDRSPKKNLKTPSPSSKTGGKQHGRRSPRNQWSSSDACAVERGLPQKLKINIFTDNLGVDLGKRVRSPRRLSEDMIALPIYSMRRTGSSPKETLGIPRSYQEGENSTEYSPKRSLPNGSPATALSSKLDIIPNTSHAPDKHSHHHPSPLELETLPSTATRDGVKKSKTHSEKNKSLLSKDLFSEEKSEKSKTFNSEGKCDNNELSSSEDKEKQNVKFLMSSICKDVIGKVASESKHLFQRISKKGDSCNSNLDSKDKSVEGNCVDTMPVDEKVPDSHSKTITIESLEDNVQSSNDGKMSNKKEQVPSLLCAMLVGGKDVAHDYSQKKEKSKPDISEASASEAEHSQEEEEEVCKGTGAKSEDFSHLNMNLNTTDILDTNADSLENDGSKYQHKDHEVDKNLLEDMNDGIKHDVKADLMDIDADVKENEGIISSHSHEQSSEIASVETSNSLNNNASENFSDLSNSVKDEKDSKAWKKTKIDFSSQLKKLNENVLSLIDVEDEITTLSQECDEEGSKEEEAEHNPEEETILYSLISSLCFRLKDTSNIIPESSPCDVDSIDQLIQSCPKTAKSCQKIRSSYIDKVRNKILERLKDEDKSEKMQKHVSSSSSVCTTNGDEIESNIISSCANKVTVDNTINLTGASTNKLESISNRDERNLSLRTPSPSERRQQGLYSTSSPSQNGSLCELDVDAMTSAASLALKTSDLDLNLSFLRSSHGECECTNKSKLGSKIPIPGSVFPYKSSQKSWRVPRIIMNPKPLQILSQLETDAPRKEIFVSTDLHKYLWMPSSRMIVTSAIREEIKRADETATCAWNAKTMILKEEEDNLQKKEDEEVNKQFSIHKPDFDEVEGLLFMSFSSEIELKAHIHVERALAWDRDDTMLRISRAKIFEETKAVNGNMKAVKMKQLRGQHMRWKKYKRLYSNEVLSMIEAKENGITLDQVIRLRKTSDLSKVKGWRNKHRPPRDISLKVKNKRNENDTNTKGRQSFSPCEQPAIYYEENIEANFDFIHDDIKVVLDEKKLDVAPRLRRQFNFSDRKVHRQLFKELKMDWEDRMIHRKLGGWSLKGNRPKAFSKAAIKRQKGDVKVTAMVSPPPFPSTETGNESVSDITMPEPETDLSLSPGNEANSMQRKKKIVYPMLTERMARNCLKTLETGDILQAMKRNKTRKRRKRQDRSRSSLPFLTVMPVEPNESSPSLVFSSQVSSTVSVKEDWSGIQTPTPSTPSATTPLNLDLLDETVLEGVDIASRISSPSVTDVQSSPQIKACSKPGCRYGCICHLCSASESPTLPESSLSKSSLPVCDKEYCRLGCICDSLHPDQSTASSPTHCGKPSCMLGCVCSDSGLQQSNQFDGSDDNIPYLPSMKQRPKIGERFSNLPRREKTHRTAKNLDAVTRKAMMLYETSEIYCEKVERVVKKKDSLEYPIKTAARAAFPLETYGPQPYYEEIDDCMSIEIIPPPQDTEPKYVPKKKDILVLDADVEMSDVVQSLPIVEPSAHKRKRKSHPLSNEIFTLSSCARIHPYVSKKKVQRLVVSDHTSRPVSQSITSSMLLMASGSSHLYSKQDGSSAGPSVKTEILQNGSSLAKIKLEPKIFNVTSLASHDVKDMSAYVDLTCNGELNEEQLSQVAGKPQNVFDLTKTEDSKHDSQVKTWRNSPEVLDLTMNDDSSTNRRAEISGKPLANLNLATIKESNHHSQMSAGTPSLSGFDKGTKANSNRNRHHSWTSDRQPERSDLAISEDLLKRNRHAQPSVMKVPAGLIPLSKIQDCGKKSSSQKETALVGKPPHCGWHTSMVCLKAKAPSKSELQKEDDVQEEDEVKLLEFAADCNWDGSKRAILGQVASCLVRGHYPQPQTMNIGEFVVEILPKAQQPTMIPPELRAKLPRQMYSIRVRITRREDPSKMNLLSPSAVRGSLIDLSVSPSSTSASSSSSNVVCTGSNILHTSSSSVSTPSSSSSLSSHIGISGMSQISVSNSNKRLSEKPTKVNSAPGSRRSSQETQKITDDTSSSMTSVPVSLSSSYQPLYSGAQNTVVNTTEKHASHSEIINSPANLSTEKKLQNVSSLVPNVPTAQKLFSPFVQPGTLLSPTSSSSLLKRASVVAGPSKGKPFLPFKSTAANAPNPVLRAANPKEVKYVHLQNNDKLMVYELDLKQNKKTLIAVPVSLACANVGEMVGKPILTVPSAGGQKTVLPLIASRPKPSHELSPQVIKMKSASSTSQSIILKVACANSSSVPVPPEQLAKSRSLLRMMPVSVSGVPGVSDVSCLNVARPRVISSKVTELSGQQILNAQPSGLTVTCQSDNTTISEQSSCKMGMTSLQKVPGTNIQTLNSDFLLTNVTQYRDRPIPSSQVSPVKEKSHSNKDDVIIVSTADALCPSTTTPVSSSEKVTGTPPSEMEVSQETNLAEDKSKPECSPETNSTILGNAESASDHTEHRRATHASDTEITSEVSGVSLSIPKNTSEDLDLSDRKASSPQPLIKSNTQEILSPFVQSNTQATGHGIDSNVLKCEVATSSSLFPIGPITDEESFNGFSVMKDIPYSILSTQNLTSVSSVELEPALNSATNIQAQGTLPENGDTGGIKITAIPLSKISALNGEAVVASHSSAPKGSNADIAAMSTSSSPRGNAMEALPSMLSGNVLKRQGRDLFSEENNTSEPKRSRVADVCDQVPGEDDAGSSCSRPKSGLSSGSSEVVNLTSDEEEIDVGDNTPFNARAYFTLQVDEASKRNQPSSCSSKKSSGGSKSIFHKYIERARRAKLKELFSSLGDMVTLAPDPSPQIPKKESYETTPKSKIMILNNARKMILDLEHKLNSDDQEVATLTSKNEKLKKELRAIKTELVKRNVPGHAIAQIVNRISRRTKKHHDSTSLQETDMADEVDGIYFKDDDDSTNHDLLWSKSNDSISPVSPSAKTDDSINLVSPGAKTDDPINLVSPSAKTDDPINLVSPISKNDNPINLASSSSKHDNPTSFVTPVSKFNNPVILASSSYKHDQKSLTPPIAKTDDRITLISSSSDNEGPMNSMRHSPKSDKPVNKMPASADEEEITASQLRMGDDTEKSIVPTAEDIGKDNDSVPYEDISDNEGHPAVALDQIVQYEDITDEENGS